MIETNEFSQNDNKIGEDLTRRPTLNEADQEGPLARGGRPYHPWAPAQGEKPLGLRFEPRSGMISLSYKLLLLLLFRFGIKYL